MYVLLLPQAAELAWLGQYQLHDTVLDEHVVSVLQELQEQATEEQAPLLEHELVPQETDYW